MPPARAVRIARIGADGDGIAADPDGAALYVPFTLPGETVQAVPCARRGEGFAATAEAITEASPDRATPPCPHFGICGGCALQHWRDAPYADWKAGLLEAALRRAGFTDVTLNPLVRTAPGGRRRVDLALRRVQGGVQVGLHRARGSDIVDLTACPVLDPTLAALIAPLRTLLVGLALLKREGSAIVNLLDAGPDLLLRTDAPPSLVDRNRLTDFARTHALPRITWALGASEPETICALRPAVTMLSGVSLAPPPGAFLQASAAAEAAIVAAVVDGLPGKRTQKTRIAELYAGCGTISFALAPHIRVAAWEGDGPAVQALRQAANQAGLAGRIEAGQRDLTRQPVSAKELAAFAAVLLDPPHAGALEQTGQIAASRIKRVIYVSCNPAALARDAKLLHDGGYRLLAATPVDQFLWSARLESVCVFGR
jgi:23S rRNA (uracil1939-C5)-methyltransferase